MMKGHTPTKSKVVKVAEVATAKAESEIINV